MADWKQKFYDSDQQFGPMDVTVYLGKLRSFQQKLDEYAADDSEFGRRALVQRVNDCRQSMGHFMKCVYPVDVAAFGTQQPPPNR